MSLKTGNLKCKHKITCHIPLYTYNFWLLDILKVNSPAEMEGAHGVRLHFLLALQEPGTKLR